MSDQEKVEALALKMAAAPCKDGSAAHGLIPYAKLLLASRAFLGRYIIEAEASGGWDSDDALFSEATALFKRLVFL